MEVPVPDIESFRPYEIDDDQLEALITNQYKELKMLYPSERSYKIDLSFALYRLINQQKMNHYMKVIERKWNQ